MPRRILPLPSFLWTSASSPFLSGCPVLCACPGDYLVSKLARIHNRLPQLPSCPYPQRFLFLTIAVLLSSYTQESALHPTTHSFLAPQGPVTSRLQLQFRYHTFNAAYSTDPSQKHRNKFNSFPLHTNK